MTTTTTATINIHISDTRRLTPTVRKRVSIPHTDLWTQDWWDAQANPSASVRRLIHEETRLHGAVDTIDRLAAPAAATAWVAPVSTPAPAVSIPVAAAPAAPTAVPAPATPAAVPVGDELAALRSEVAAVRDLLSTLIPALTGLEDARVF